jgi:phosphomannomutase
MPELETRLLELLAASKFSLRTGNHIEYRPGGINFSIVGRMASFSDRQEYVVFDKLTGERNLLADTLNKEFPHLETTVGGETGIDIVAAGCNKSQIISHFSNDTTLVFFGDATQVRGNDYPLAKVISDKQLGVTNTVSYWEDTYRLLLKI